MHLHVTTVQLATKRFAMRLFLFFFFILLAVQCSIQCPDGWRQSTLDKNTCYRVIVSKKIWFEAEAYCNAAAPGAHLTSILSAYETFSLDAIVTDTPSISVCDQLWIGANDFDQNGKFVWSNGDSFQYSKWGPSQPDLSNQCVSSQARTTGAWKTEPCGTENCFICEQKSATQGTTTPSAGTATDCYDWMHINDATKSGIYRISPPGISPFDVYCDMDTNEGGWTVFQKRVDDSFEFYSLYWADYKMGFGNGLNRNYWLGNDRLHVLSTKDSNVQLRVDMWNDRIASSDNPSGYWFGECPHFAVQDEANYYRLYISNVCTGNASANKIFDYNGYRAFVTFDKDPDGSDCTRHFATLGAWWYGDYDSNGCSSYSLNGRYEGSVPPNAPGHQDFSWADFSTSTTVYRFPSHSEMKLRKVA